MILHNEAVSNRLSPCNRRVSFLKVIDKNQQKHKPYFSTLFNEVTRDHDK